MAFDVCMYGGVDEQASAFYTFFLACQCIQVRVYVGCVVWVDDKRQGVNAPTDIRGAANACVCVLSASKFLVGRVAAAALCSQRNEQQQQREQKRKYNDERNNEGNKPECSTSSVKE